MSSRLPPRADGVQPPAPSESRGSSVCTEAVESMDLRGVKCPLNWARAKVRLEDLPSGAVLELVVDDPRAVRDIPRAAEAHGHVVTSVGPVAAEPADAVHAWCIRIER